MVHHLPKLALKLQARRKIHIIRMGNIEIRIVFTISPSSFNNRKEVVRCLIVICRMR